MLPDIQPGNTKILYFFNCLLDGMHTKQVKALTVLYLVPCQHFGVYFAPYQILLVMGAVFVLLAIPFLLFYDRTVLPLCNRCLPWQECTCMPTATAL